MVRFSSGEVHAQPTPRFGLWSDRFSRGRRWTIPVLLVVAFALGIVVQRAGMLGKARTAVGLTNQTLNQWRGWLDHPVMAARASLGGSRLQTLYVDMSFENVQLIEQKRTEALERGFLFTEPDDQVPARIRADDDEIRVRMRLKGDLVDHLVSDKWSFRVETRGDGQLFGMRRFSIQHPMTRNYLAEWAWLETLRREGVLAPRYDFVRVFFNGTPQGVYALEEHFSKELMEFQERREGVFVTWDESPLWERWDASGEEPWDHDVVRLFGFRSAEVDVRREGRVAGDSLLTRQWDAANGLLRAFEEGTRPASEVFDVELLGRFLAISELWEARHGLIWNNMQFYYNPVTARLEPVGFDGNPQEWVDVDLAALLGPWTIRALEDPEVARAYVSELKRVSDPAYLDTLRAELDDQLREYQLALFHEFPAVRELTLWSTVARKQRFIRGLLTASTTMIAWAERPDVALTRGASDTVEVSVRNLTAFPLAVRGLRGPSGLVGIDPDLNPEVSLDGSGQLLMSGTRDEVASLAGATRLHFPISWPQADSVAPSFTIVSRISGTEDDRDAPLQWYGSTFRESHVPKAPTLQAALETHRFLEVKDEGTLGVRPGEWDVSGDLVLPAGVGLKVGAGTSLRFSTGAVMLVRGPLQLTGTPDAPAVLEPAGETWSGVVVMDAGATSTLSHALIRGTSAVEREGWLLTGGITFYRSPVEIVGTDIVGSVAEDALNVIQAEVAISKSRFLDHASDAFDGDFVVGTIEEVTFSNTVGDGIDVSGSRLEVRRVRFEGLGDKGLSVGEGSEVNASAIFASDVGIAVASKDLSSVVLDDLTIEGARYFGLAVYVKKPEFGPARLRATNVQASGVEVGVVVQTGSQAHVNGVLVEGSELDVERLYDAGILGN